MANSPGHRFGQIIGNLLEEIVTPKLQEFCDQKHLYLDRQGLRGKVRPGKKVTWTDKYGNTHDLDFVIEKDGTDQKRGRPVAFIEAAWRRYTKHSRNKAQEIQGALLPIAEEHYQDKPFLGSVLAGVFTQGSLTQMESNGFEIVLFPYEIIVQAFQESGINVAFDEKTPREQFELAIQEIESLDTEENQKLKNRIIELNQNSLNHFFNELNNTLGRQIIRVAVIPLYGFSLEFDTTDAATNFVRGYDEVMSCEKFQRYEITVHFSNQDKIEASFSSKERVIEFLYYVEGGVNKA